MNIHYIKGKFYDGISSQANMVDIYIEHNCLVFEAQHSPPETIQWPLADCVVRSKPNKNRPAVIANKYNDDARLILEQEDYNELIVAAPKLKSLPFLLALPWRWIAALCALAVLFIGSMTIIIPAASDEIAQNIPESFERHLGKWVGNMVLHGRVECMAPEGQEALNKLKQKLIADLDLPYSPSVKVYYFSEPGAINAFAISGNQVIIMNQLLEFSDNPDELAGVLAHELGHVYYRHPTAGLFKAYGAKILMSSIFGTSMPTGEVLLQLKYSRDAETVADDFAIKQLNNNNISIKSFANFFEKIGNLQPSERDNKIYRKINEYTSSHPLTEYRINRINNAHIKQKDTTPSLNDDEWQSLKSICDQVGKR